MNKGGGRSEGAVTDGGGIEDVDTKYCFLKQVTDGIIFSAIFYALAVESTAKDPRCCKYPASVPHTSLYLTAFGGLVECKENLRV